MDVERVQPRLQRVVERLGPKHAAAAVQHPHLTIQRGIPVAGPDASGQHPVEQFRTRCRQQHAAFLAPDPMPCKHRHGLLHVAAAAAEPLFTEIIGHALCCHRMQPRFNGLALAVHVAQCQHEAVAGQCAARQLARVPDMLEHAQFIGLQGLDVRRDLFRQPHAETLSGDCVPVLHAGIADGRFRHARPLRNALGREGSVHAALFDGQ